VRERKAGRLEGLLGPGVYFPGARFVRVASPGCGAAR
jgi:hypothetical protein